jgi:hypothetical protein
MPDPFTWQAIKEWIAGAPLWPCQPARSSSGSCFHHSPPKCGWSVPDDEPNLNWFNQESDSTGAEPECSDQSPDGKPEEIPLGDGRTLVLDPT